MSLSNFTDLQTSIADHMGRATGDATIAAIAPVLIQLFEAKFQRRVRSREMETRNTAFAISAAATNLPTGFLEMRGDPVLQTSPLARLDFMTPDQLAERYPFSTSTSQPEAWTIIGGQLVVAPAPDAAYTAEIEYYSFTALSSGAPTNWLLTGYSDIYLAGCLVEGFAYARNPDAAALWKARLDEAIEELLQSDFMGRYPKGSLVARPSGSTP